MDDGYTRIRAGGRQLLAEIATVSFSDAELQILLHGLLRLGRPEGIARTDLLRRPQYEGSVPMHRALRPPSMRYKLHPRSKSRAIRSKVLTAGPPGALTRRSRRRHSQASDGYDAVLH